MNHPPIPPNCKYFEGQAFVLLSGEFWPISYAKDNSKYWPPLIAAIARCGWLDEAERMDAERCALDSQSKTYYERTSALIEAEFKACDNAKAWKKWGERAAK